MPDNKDIETDYNGIIIRLRNANESVLFETLVKKSATKNCEQTNWY